MPFTLSQFFIFLAAISSQKSLPSHQKKIQLLTTCDVSVKMATLRVTAQHSPVTTAVTKGMKYSDHVILTQKIAKFMITRSCRFVLYY